MDMVADNLGAVIKSTGQFSTDFDIRARLEGLFEEVLSRAANFAARDATFFTSVWQEIQHLIKVKIKHLAKLYTEFSVRVCM
jgi:hypothetical protein